KHLVILKPKPHEHRHASMHYNKAYPDDQAKPARKGKEGNRLKDHSTREKSPGHPGTLEQPNRLRWVAQIHRIEPAEIVLPLCFDHIERNVVGIPKPHPTAREELRQK